MRGLRLSLAFLVAGLAVACDDDGGPIADRVDGAADGGLDVLDLGQGDLSLDIGQSDTQAEVSTVGQGCSGANDCKPDAPDCLVFDTAGNRGVCSTQCKPDNPDTPLVNEDDCPRPNFLCASFRFGEDTYNYCLRGCTPSLTSNDCPASSGTRCDPTSTRLSDLDLPVCWEAACVDDQDCPVISATPCSSAGECAALGADAFCDPAQRQCARPGNCTPGGLCGPHTLGKAGAQVGDACASDFDCSANGVCLVEDGAAGPFSPVYRNGYCTVLSCAFSASMPEFGCPAGSACHGLFYGGMCHKKCDPASVADCRGEAADKGGDYECYSWNNLFIGGVAVASDPVCQSTALQSCDSLGTSLQCADLAPQGNASNMRCRDRLTGADRPTRDPGGVCLDDTASGDFEPLAADGGVVDAGVVDAGVVDAGVVDAGVVDAGVVDAGVGG